MVHIGLGHFSATGNYLQFNPWTSPATHQSAHRPNPNPMRTGMNMNKLNLLAYPLVTLMALFSAGAALADSPTPDNTASQVWAQTKTRAQVQAELLQARADGSIKMTSISYNPLAASQSVKTREAVRAEMLAARASGEAAANVGEDSGSAYLARATTPADTTHLLARVK
jgi:hypothetical protein